jgi:hypothetical protein
MQENILWYVHPVLEYDRETNKYTDMAQFEKWEQEENLPLEALILRMVPIMTEDTNVCNNVSIMLCIKVNNKSYYQSKPHL